MPPGFLGYNERHQRMARERDCNPEQSRRLRNPRTTARTVRVIAV